MSGTGTDPTTCRDTATGRLKQLVYQRARGRAVARLIRAHQDEYDALLATEKQHAQAEADALDLTARQNGKADKTHPDEPVRLKSGRRGKGQTVLDRLDVARCPHCITHHDRGHVCPNCGAVPERPECGTEKGYQKHRHLKELACQRCLKAHATHEHDRQQRATRPATPIRPRRTTTVDPAALAEFNAGTERARNASNRSRRSTA